MLSSGYFADALYEVNFQCPTDELFLKSLDRVNEQVNRLVLLLAASQMHKIINWQKLKSAAGERLFQPCHVIFGIFHCEIIQKVLVPHSWGAVLWFCSGQDYRKPKAKHSLARIEL